MCVALETPSRPPPPFMANAILNFHFDYWHTSLIVGRDCRDKSQLWELLVKIDNDNYMEKYKDKEKNALGDDEPLSYSNCHMATVPSAIT